MRCQHCSCSRNYGCDKAFEANKVKATDADKADEAEATEANKADEADSHDKAIDAPEAKEAKATEADKADEAEADDTNEANEPMIQRGHPVDEANDTIADNNADKAGNASVASKANESFVADKANVIDVIVAADKAIVTDTANLAIKANEASFAKAKELLANSIAIVLYSLTKYCEVFAKNKGYFGMTISNNQREIFGRCDWHCTCSLTIEIKKIGQQSTGSW